jgi:lipoprotein-anchoring transpeptidase ErfK/SrfK
LDRSNPRLGALRGCLILLCALLLITILAPAAVAQTVLPTATPPIESTVTPTGESEGLLHEEVLPRPRIYDSPRFPVETELRETKVTSRAPFIYIHQNSQMMYVFEYGRVIRQIPMSTGLDTPRTVTKPWVGRVGVYWGTFFAYDVFADEAWYLFKDDGSILIHSSPYTLDDDATKVYQDLDRLGRLPASHGCIRISPEDAAWFTAWGPSGALTCITPLTSSFPDE